MYSYKNARFHDQIRKWDTTQLIQALEINGLGDCCDAVKSREIDGNGFLNLTEGQLSFWRNTLSTVQIRRLWSYIQLAQEKPQDFIINIPASTPSTATLNIRRTEKIKSPIAESLENLLGGQNISSTIVPQQPETPESNYQNPMPPLHSNDFQQCVPPRPGALPPKPPNLSRRPPVPPLSIVNSPQDFTSRVHVPIPSSVHNYPNVTPMPPPSSNNYPKVIPELPPSRNPPLDITLRAPVPIPSSVHNYPNVTPMTPPSSKNYPKITPMPSSSNSNYPKVTPMPPSSTNNYPKVTPIQRISPSFNNYPKLPPLPQNPPPYPKPPSVPTFPDHEDEEVDYEEEPMSEPNNDFQQPDTQIYNVPSSNPIPIRKEAPLPTNYGRPLPTPPKDEPPFPLPPNVFPVVRNSRSPQPPDLPRPPFLPPPSIPHFSDDEEEQTEYDTVAEHLPEYMSKPWFKDVDRKKAAILLRGRPNGTFLARPSKQPNYECTFSVIYEDKIYNLAVMKDDGKVVLGKNVFDTVSDIVEKFFEQPLVLNGPNNEDVFVTLRKF